MELEKLLKKLIKRGWKPRWYEDVYKFKLYKWWYTINRPQKQKLISFATETRHYINWTDYIWYKWYSLRELFSKESWLWQFCCKNKLVNIWKTYLAAYTKRFRDVYELRKDESDEYSDTEYEYRIIESSLRDESKLERFLVDHINI